MSAIDYVVERIEVSLAGVIDFSLGLANNLNHQIHLCPNFIDKTPQKHNQNDGFLQFPSLTIFLMCNY
jgi:hypothetical protein